MGRKLHNSDAEELPKRKHTTFRTRRKFEIKNTSPLWGGNCIIQTPGNDPEESIQRLEHGESLKSRILHPYGEETA